ncbi:unnamed protein product [Sphenostylis stenocarpa]|uniref:Uncharacterized protein n=1 Tax=Sphenostylis stenocarpa TaxID=92480 RepID=A0AA86W5E1_9FABA|nr:unnamed protein product [Sphenostylis stenocarpa]
MCQNYYNTTHVVPHNNTVDAYPAINVGIKGRLRSNFKPIPPTDHRHVPFDALDSTTPLGLKWYRLFFKHLSFLMAGFEQQVKDRAKELKVLLKKGVKIVGDSCKKGWNKVKHIKR